MLLYLTAYGDRCYDDRSIVVRRCRFLTVSRHLLLRYSEIGSGHGIGVLLRTFAGRDFSYYHALHNRRQVHARACLYKMIFG
jgi:hypothetical protein